MKYSFVTELAKIWNSQVGPVRYDTTDPHIARSEALLFHVNYVPQAILGGMHKLYKQILQNTLFPAPTTPAKLRPAWSSGRFILINFPFAHRVSYKPKHW